MPSVRSLSACLLALLLMLSGGLHSREATAQTAKRSSSRAEPEAYWIFLDGKPDSPTAAISERARERRARRGQPHAEELDRSVSPGYLRALAEAGVEVQTESRWLNAVSARLTEETLFRLREMDFVREIRPVARRKNTLPEAVSDAPPSTLHAKRGGDRYGFSRTQLELMNAIEPLERGINGRGVRLGFLDTPFNDLNHSAFDSLKKDNRLIAIRNFTGMTDDRSAHGLNVASIAAGYQEGRLIGPAHGAEILAGITEYAPTETNREEDNMVAALEWMEGEGVDVVNISLGYTTFDSGQRSYEVEDMDGDTGVTTIAADKAAALGVAVVTSAGNSGCSSPTQCWFYISTPADADSVITVGAVRSDSTAAGFTSRGPTADGRIKPDVAAMGVSTFVAVASDRDGYSYVNGTSFSGPLTAAVVAQMLQVNPDLNPIEVRDILRKTAGQADSPDNVLGWGIVNADAAIRMAESMAPPTSADSDELPAGVALLGNYPNPFNPETTIRYALGQAGVVRLAVYDLLGREAATLVNETKSAGEHQIRFDASHLPGGAYVYRLQTQDKIVARTMLLVK